MSRPTSLSPIFSGQAAAIAIEQGLFSGLVGLDSSLGWSGPFTVKKAVAGDPVTLVRNPAYSTGRQGSAHLDKVVFRALSSRQAVLAAAKAGDGQVGTRLDERDLATIAGLTGVRAHLLPALQYEQVGFNQADPNPTTGLAPARAASFPSISGWTLAS